MTPDDLISWRTSEGLSQAEAAEVLGYSRGYYVEFEKGRRPLPVMLPMFLAARYHRIRPYPECLSS